MADYTPTIHLNGSGRQRLLDQARDAADALREAIDALRLMSPNGRDFYPQGDGAIRAAIAAHTQRIATIEGIHAEVMAYAERVADAPGPR